MKYLAILLLVGCSLGQVINQPGTSTNNTWTGAQTFTSAIGNFNIQSLDNTVSTNPIFRFFLPADVASQTAAIDISGDAGIYTRGYLVVSGVGNGLTGTSYQLVHPTSEPFMIGAYGDIIGPSVALRSGNDTAGTRTLTSYDTSANARFNIENDGSLSWGATTYSARDTFLLRDGAGILSERNGTTAVTHRVYTSFTDASHYEFVALEGNPFADSNPGLLVRGAGAVPNPNLYVGTVGTGSLKFVVNSFNPWQLISAGHIVTTTDNAFDIGQSGSARPRNLFLGSRAQVGTTAFASLPACGASLEGAIEAVTDSSTATWGATITGSSTNHVLAYCDGTNWTVAAK